MLFDLHFRYEDDEMIRPLVINCPLSQVGKYSKEVANLACVEQVFINIHPSCPGCDFHEFTI